MAAGHRTSAGAECADGGGGAFRRRDARWRRRAFRRGGVTTFSGGGARHFARRCGGTSVAAARDISAAVGGTTAAGSRLPIHRWAISVAAAGQQSTATGKFSSNRQRQSAIRAVHQALNSRAVAALCITRARCASGHTRPDRSTRRPRDGITGTAALVATRPWRLRLGRPLSGHSAYYDMYGYAMWGLRTPPPFWDRLQRHLCRNVRSLRV